MAVDLYPFPNQFPLGLGQGDGVRRHLIGNMAAQVARAGEGRQHTDWNQLKNWSPFLAMSFGGGPTSVGKAPVYDRRSRRWLVFGMNVVVEGEAWYTIGGARWTFASSIEASAPGANLVPACAFCNAAGVMLVGGDGVSAGSTINKLRESTDGGETWTYRAIGASDTSKVVSICYSERLRIWVASQSGAEPGVWSSTDRVTWTKRLSFTLGNLTIRESPTALFVGTGTVNQGAGYRTSLDGLTWTSATFPVTCQELEHAVCYSEALGAFFVPTAANGIWTSTTGATSSWTQVSTFNDTQLGAFGRALVRGDGQISIDGGVTWIPVLEATVVDLLPVCAPGIGVMLCSDAAPGDAFLSHLGGS